MYPFRNSRWSPGGDPTPTLKQLHRHNDDVSWSIFHTNLRWSSLGIMVPMAMANVDKKRWKDPPCFFYCHSHYQRVSNCLTHFNIGHLNNTTSISAINSKTHSEITMFNGNLNIYPIHNPWKHYFFVPWKNSIESPWKSHEIPMKSPWNPPGVGCLPSLRAGAMAKRPAKWFPDHLWFNGDFMVISWGLMGLYSSSMNFNGLSSGLIKFHGDLMGFNGV